MAIVYRNLPLDQLHQKARPEAIASECVAKLGDNDKFWQFVDKIFETTTSNDGLDLALLPTFAKELGIDEGAFNNCLEDSEVQEALEKVAEGASLAGAQGTPYPIVVKGDKVLGSLPGALPADDLRKVVDQVTAEK